MEVTAGQPRGVVRSSIEEKKGGGSLELYQSAKKGVKAGFTVVELLIVVIVIAILAVVTVVSYNGITNNAHQTVTAANVKTYTEAIEMYALKNHTYPQGAGCLGVDAETASPGCLFFTIRGAGCTALGYVVGERMTIREAMGLEPLPANNSLNEALLAYMPNPPSRVQTQPHIHSQDTGDCYVARMSTAPSYVSACKATVKPEWTDVRITFSSACGGEGVYVITYFMPGDARCETPKSARRYDPVENTTLCTVVGGDFEVAEW